MLDSTRKKMRQLLVAGVDSKVAYDEIRERFEQVNASRYGHSMPQWVPDYEAVHTLLMETVALSISAEILTPHILDLGAGTGRVTQLLLDAFPTAHVTALDNSANMLSAIADFPTAFATRTTALEADFFSSQPILPDQQFDAIASVFAVCHGRSIDDYRRLYQRIYDWLKPGSYFACLDHVIGANPQLSALAFAQ